MTTNPYDALDPSAFWRPAVADRHMFDIEGLWRPKADVRPKDPVATYGSCFAQNIGRALRDSGYRWLRTEVPPVGLSDDDRRRFNYDVFTSRTGNIYTATLLQQWTEWATGAAEPPAEVWCTGERFIDPFRPRIEPDGFATEEELFRTRTHTIDCFRDSISKSRHFVFTFGLTECWRNRKGGYEYPMFPAAVGGTYNPALHEHCILDYDDVRNAMLRTMRLMREVNPRLRFLLTVSPIPLTATLSGQHVVVATMHTKSTLRAVAGKLASTFDYVDYFPSYEIINSPVFKGTYFAPNQRNVSKAGVDFVMKTFMSCLDMTFGDTRPTAEPETSADDDGQAEPAAAGREPQPDDAQRSPKAHRKSKLARAAANGSGKAQARRMRHSGSEDDVCEEALLAAFGKDT